MIISKQFTFEASHILPLHPGKCARLHGHSWTLEVAVEGPVNPTTGFVCDFAKLSELVHTAIIQHVDHYHLGQGIATVNGSMQYNTLFKNLNFYPSSENLVTAFAVILQPLVKELGDDIRLCEVSLDETCTSRASIWIIPKQGSDE